MMESVLGYFENNPGTGLVVGVVAGGLFWIAASMVIAWAMGDGKEKDRGRSR